MRGHQLFCCVAVLFCVAGYAQNVGNIATVAGTGTGGFSGDGGLSVSAKLFYPYGVGVDKTGYLYIADTNNNRIRKVNTSTFVITTVAGSGKSSFCGDGGPAISACLSRPTGVAVDSTGNLFIADNGNYRIRKVDPSGKITTYAGNGSPTFCGDGQLATLACLHTPTGVARSMQEAMFTLLTGIPTGYARSGCRPGSSLRSRAPGRWARPATGDWQSLLS